MLLFFSLFIQNAYAEPMKCEKNQGLWLKATGEVVCMTCPNKDEKVAGKAFKMPLNCITPIYGALLDIELYTYLKSQEEYANQLEAFKNGLKPSLEKIKDKLDKSVEFFVLANQRQESMLKLVESLNVENEKLKTANSFLMYGAIGLGVTTAIFTYAHFYYGH